MNYVYVNSLYLISIGSCLIRDESNEIAREFQSKKLEYEKWKMIWKNIWMPFKIFMLKSD